MGRLGISTAIGDRGGRPFIVNIWSKPKTSVFVPHFFPLRAVRLDTWSKAPQVMVDCQMEEPIRKELLSSIARLPSPANQLFITVCHWVSTIGDCQNYMNHVVSTKYLVSPMEFLQLYMAANVETQSLSRLAVTDLQLHFMQPGL